MTSRKLARALPLAIVVAAIALATLWPTHLPTQSVTSCIYCGPLAGVDFFGNIALFVPFGMAAFRWRARLPWVLLSGAIFAGLIETFQWQLVAGRDASLGDLVANSTGSAIGGLVASRAGVLLHPVTRAAWRLWLVWSGTIIAFAAAAAWGLAPERPIYVYWSQWTPVRTGYTAFTGRLDSLFLFGHAIPNGTHIDPVRAPAPYSDGRLRIRALVTSASPNSRRALVARAGNPLGERFQLAQNGTSLVFRGRVNAARIGLRSPTMEFRSVFSPGPHYLDVTLDRRATTVLVDGVHAAGSPSHMTLGYAWQLFMPFEVWSATLHRAAACIFFGALFLPVGYWDRSAARRIVPARSLVVGAAALLAVPVFFGMSVAGWAEMLGALAGIILGAVLGVRRDDARVS